VIVACAAMAVALAVALAWRSAWAPAAGALAGVAIALGGGAVELGDVERAARDLWRPMIVIVGIMATAACANKLGVFTQLAAWIEPYTHGPVRFAFRVVFALSALVAATLSNDAAILLFTPVVIELIRQMYPLRHEKLVVPFAFAVFVAAGVAPLPTGNPMNLVVAERAGIHFNAYVAHMLPVAIVGWFVAYAMLAHCFRAELADEVPARGRMKTAVPIGTPAKIVIATAGASVISYPILAELGARLWFVAAPAALICVLAAHRGGVPVRRIAGAISWELLPFVFGMLVLATALARAGATSELADLYARSSAPVATVGVIGALGSAIVNNHPMALLHSIALHGAPDRMVYAALVGGDLGPRMLPIGSLAGLLWLHGLRRRGLAIPLSMFVRVGAIVTIPSLVVSLVVLWLVTM